MRRPRSVFFRPPQGVLGAVWWGAPGIRSGGGGVGRVPGVCFPSPPVCPVLSPCFALVMTRLRLCSRPAEGGGADHRPDLVCLSPGMVYTDHSFIVRRLHSPIVQSPLYPHSDVEGPGWLRIVWTSFQRFM